jgi:hypothetical protein
MVAIRNVARVSDPPPAAAAAAAWPGAAPLHAAQVPRHHATTAITVATPSLPLLPSLSPRHHTIVAITVAAPSRHHCRRAITPSLSPRPS